jgi:uncharacterized membrane protein
MSSPVIFSLTASQRDFLAALAVNPATWKTFPKATRTAAVRNGYTTRETRPVLTPAGQAVAGLALFLSRLAHTEMPPVERRP